MIKSPVPRCPKVRDIRDILSLRQHLSADIIDARHVLTGQSAKIMSKARSAPRMLVVVLDQMTDVFHAMRRAPIPQLPGEILLHPPGHPVHIDVSDLCRQAFSEFSFPQKGQVLYVLRSPDLLQIPLQTSAPGLITYLIDFPIHLIKMSVSDLRLIGEKARNGLPEILVIMCVMRLINRLYQCVAGLLIQHVHVIPVRSAVSRQL